MTAAAQSTLKVAANQQTHDEELRLWLEEHLKSHANLNVNILARSTHTGVHVSTLKPYLEGTYFLPKEAGGHGVKPGGGNVEAKIRAYRETVEGVVVEGYSTSFVKGRAWHQFTAACNMAIKERSIVVIYSPPGSGKTRCKQEYLTVNATMPIDILCSAVITTKHFVEMIAASLSITEKLPVSQLTEMIAKRLRNNVRPIMVDQANYLNEKALGILCHFWEVAKVPIILIGTADLYKLFTSSDMTQDVRSQLSSRVAMHCELFTLSLTEFKTIVGKAFDKETVKLLEDLFGEHGIDFAIGRLFELCGGFTNERQESVGANHRHMTMVAPRFINMLHKNAAGLKGIKTDEQRKIEFEKMLLKIGAKLFIG
jgi:DNA transposition AAA+ family ATPase